jgi:hypothetical protein
VYTEKAIEMVAASVGVPSNGHRTVVESSTDKAKKKPAKRGNGNGGAVAEVGEHELLGEQQPGDAVAGPAAKESAKK